MNRLWVRLGLMVSGVLFFVFFMQFLSIVLIPDPPLTGEYTEEDMARIQAQNAAEHADIFQKLFLFLVFSTVVGLAGGAIIGRVVGAPISELAQAARKIGEGDLSTRVIVRGAQETVVLGETFNKMAADLQRAEEIRANLMADVSHELRTPLTVLEGNLRAALDQIYALDEAEIANLYSQTHHLIRLVNDLRELTLAESHRLPMQKQPIHINTLLAETIQALEPLALEVEVRLSNQAPTLPMINGDPFRIKQVFFNLLINALRHTPAGGQIAIIGNHDDAQMWLSVKDNGEGLEPDQLRAVFDRFYRTDKSRSRETGGTGLGLAIVKAIVEAHNGNITAYSQGKDRGSEFIVTLPIV